MKADRLVALMMGVGLAMGSGSAALAQGQPSGTMEPGAGMAGPSTLAPAGSGAGTVDDVLGTGALPGVSIGTSTAPDMSGISGPGGLQNGIGAQGMSAPSMSGSAVTNDGSIPGTSDSGGFGIPLDTLTTPDN